MSPLAQVDKRGEDVSVRIHSQPSESVWQAHHAPHLFLGDIPCLSASPLGQQSSGDLEAQSA